MIPIIPQPEPISLAINAAASLLPQLIGSLGKSPTQKNAEYELSRIANEIEKAMNINALAFRAGYLSQAFALQNYEYLWSLLVQSSDAAMAISPAQATRQITDRDYGGIFASTWRVQFRDDQILGIGEDCLENGYVIPACQWDLDLGNLKYGAEGTTLVNVPTPTEIITPAGVAGVGGALRGLPAPLKLAGLGVLGFLGWRLFR